MEFIPRWNGVPPKATKHKWENLPVTLSTFFTKPFTDTGRLQKKHQPCCLFSLGLALPEVLETNRAAVFTTDLIVAGSDAKRKKCTQFSNAEYIGALTNTTGLVTRCFFAYSD